MSTSATISRCIGDIVADTSAAIGALKRWSDDPTASNAPPVKGRRFDQADVDMFESMLDSYAALLRRVARHVAPNLAARCKRAESLLLGSFEGRVCAVLRTLYGKKHYAAPATILALAEQLDVLTPIVEPVRVNWAAKHKGGYRIIVMFGPRRTTLCLIVRDMLSVLGIDSPIDFSRKGGGGERGLVNKVCDLITKNYDWWWTPDIKSCFASIRPGHLSWLPIDRRLLMNIVFLPRCAKIEVIKPKDVGPILHHLKATHPDLTVGSIGDLTQPTIQMVRRGLPQGSVLSPLLARAVVGRILRDGLSETNAEGFSYCDDLMIGARTKGDAKAAKHVVTATLSSHPAGPLELHPCPIRSIYSGQVRALGYALQPGRGYKGIAVHVKPGWPRIERFKRELARRLSKATSDEEARAIAWAYWVRWFKGQQAWTKIPVLSADVSWTITLCYVYDFLHGQPMGGGEIPKPTKPLLGQEQMSDAA
jgi:hypothetical protein